MLWKLLQNNCLLSISENFPTGYNQLYLCVLLVHFRITKDMVNCMIRFCRKKVKIWMIYKNFSYADWFSYFLNFLNFCFWSLCEEQFLKKVGKNWKSPECMISHFFSFVEQISLASKLDNKTRWSWYPQLRFLRKAVISSTISGGLKMVEVFLKIRWSGDDVIIINSLTFTNMISIDLHIDFSLFSTLISTNIISKKACFHAQKSFKFLKGWIN